MKKLIAIVSVLAAGFVGTAKADITMSAGQSLEMLSVGSETNISIGGSLGFAFSQDLGNGVTVTMQGLSFGNDVDVTGDNIVSDTQSNRLITTTYSATTNAANATTTSISSTGGLATTDASIDSDAFEQISFATANGTVTYGSDIEIEYADMGVGNQHASDLTDAKLGASSSTISLTGTAGNGFTYATSIGGTSVTFGYLMDNGGGEDLFDSSATADSTMGISTSLPIGPLSVAIGYQSNDATATKQTAYGLKTSMAAGNGTATVAYTSLDNVGADATQVSASYATTLGAASLSVGYSSTEMDGKTTSTMTTATISQSIGTGASVFAEFASKDGMAATTTETSALLVGSSFAF